MCSEVYRNSFSLFSLVVLLAMESLLEVEVKLSAEKRKLFADVSLPPSSQMEQKRSCCRLD